MSDSEFDDGSPFEDYSSDEDDFVDDADLSVCARRAHDTSWSQSAPHGLWNGCAGRHGGSLVSTWTYFERQVLVYHLPIFHDFYALPSINIIAMLPDMLGSTCIALYLAQPAYSLTLTAPAHWLSWLPLLAAGL